MQKLLKISLGCDPLALQSDSMGVIRWMRAGPTRFSQSQIERQRNYFRSAEDGKNCVHGKIVYLFYISYRRAWLTKPNRQKIGYSENIKKSLFISQRVFSSSIQLWKLTFFLAVSSGHTNYRQTFDASIFTVRRFSKASREVADCWVERFHVL